MLRPGEGHRDHFCGHIGVAGGGHLVRQRFQGHIHIPDLVIHSTVDNAQILHGDIHGAALRIPGVHFNNDLAGGINIRQTVTVQNVRHLTGDLADLIPVQENPALIQGAGEAEILVGVGVARGRAGGKLLLGRRAIGILRASAAGGKAHGQQQRQQQRAEFLGFYHLFLLL